MTDKTKILVNERVQCGFPGITRFHCVAIRGCCFDDESGTKLLNPMDQNLRHSKSNFFQVQDQNAFIQQVQTHQTWHWLHRIWTVQLMKLTIEIFLVPYVLVKEIGTVPSIKVFLYAMESFRAG